MTWVAVDLDRFNRGAASTSGRCYLLVAAAPSAAATSWSLAIFGFAVLRLSWFFGFAASRLFASPVRLNDAGAE
ncbi:hypothetical protein ADL15_13630 [Actinoplanes awajinensis subsp. mycoplanecinus]|uniref:Uncharacterized protein n=1 Tax=Actinoplanes awajinensis subsp. mycoplanecinus TaxID=135947 RepID=A0A0X3UT80_9ACTN|nr:hypothetical protein ADL15_13630 [Actinoplanes awajinensis subsp. mycoplanecinus]